MRRRVCVIALGSILLLPANVYSSAQAGVATAAAGGPTPISIATTGYTIVKTILGLIHSDNYNAQIAKELKSIEADDQKILENLALLSSAIDRLQGSVDAGRQENLDVWKAWFTGLLNNPIAEFSTEVESYSRLGRPTRAQMQAHVKRMRRIYEDFENPMTEGAAYRNPMADQLSLAVLVEERAGELADPKPTKGDELIVAHRLQILVNRIQLLADMSDPASKGSIANILATNTNLENDLSKDLAYVDAHYVGRDLPYRTELFHQSEQRGDQICSVTITRRHLAFISKNEKGYSMVDHVQQDQKHDDECRYTHNGASHEGGPHQKTADTEPPSHLPGVPPDGDISNLQTDWVANVFKYQSAWNAYNQAVAIVQQLTPVEKTLEAALADLNVSFKSLHTTCQHLGHIDCNSDTPHVLIAER